MAISTTYYIDTTIFSTATAVWTEPTLTTKAPDGYYSFGGDYREQVSGLLTDLISCSNCVLICDQTWTNKNLDVTTYSNGDPIPEVTDPTAWAALTTGAWCYYSNNTANGSVYGKLYNWYAVNDPRGLAPIGYHIPTDAEWTTLTTCLGGETIAGGKMKSTGILLWASPNTDATNSSGFTGLPGGSRNMFGTFENIGFYDSFWSSTEYDSFNAWDRYLSYDNDNAGRGFINKKIGCSVRLIKDEEPTLKEFLISNLSDPTDACGLLITNTVYVSNTTSFGADTTITGTSVIYTNPAGTITFIGDGNYYALFCDDLSNTVTTNQRITSGGTITGGIGICAL